MQGLWAGVGALVLVSGHYEANADMMPTLQVVDVTPEAAAESAVASAAAAAAATVPPSTPPPPPSPAAAAAGVSPMPPPPPRRSEAGVDGAGVEGSRDLGKQLSVRLSLRRSSMGGTPLRSFSKNS